MSDPARLGMVIGADPKFDWPHDQRYANNCACGVQFYGPKGPPSCWKCAPESTKTWWLAKFSTDTIE